MFIDDLTPETAALLPVGNSAVAGGHQRQFRRDVENRHLFHCKEQNFDFPFCNKSLNQFRTVLNVNAIQVEIPDRCLLLQETHFERK
jgi:hypothetical protein